MSEKYHARFAPEYGEKPRVPYQASEHRGQRSITEAVARIPFEAYANLYPGQSFERLHERGGFGVEESIMLAFVAGAMSNGGDARKALAEYQDRVKPQ